MAHCVTIAMTFRWALLWICSELTTALGGSELTKPWETCEQSGHWWKCWIEAFRGIGNLPLHKWGNLRRFFVKLLSNRTVAMEKYIVFEKCRCVQNEGP
eukprot:CAMPEP_0194207566 /NCGR_PEP_ID=MMETSP0156-20130528/6273_1 /TAXON_ID=33649 /ORGANISM="Thalassionema nitzschioides, Strain L26-B" /LENGTH=98 /DNA_ID=CAMNT_0038934361 /DNA_START=146 /DNA_END=439 /DNA_ORIENTATION=-